jgi:N-acetylmuramoyl-L-alanine amidase
LTLTHPSPNFDDRDGPVSLVVLHFTGMSSADLAIARLRDPAPIEGRYPGPWQKPDVDPNASLAKVSSHYVVREDGEVCSLVEEDKRAWHAGRSHWRGRDGVNGVSIGIEIANGGYDYGLPPYPDAQIDSVITLVRAILKRHGLDARAVVGHSDVAPARKNDPGEHFPWARLAVAGVAIHPEIEDTPRYPLASLGFEGALAARLRWKLRQIGYGIAEGSIYDEDLSNVVNAVQQRIRPGLIDGALDLETSALIDDFMARMTGPPPPG